VGERKQHIDKVNAKRKEVHGLIAKLPHEQLGLPSNFAELFFRHDGAHDAEEKETIESVKDNIAALTEELKEQQARLAELEAEEEAAKKAAAEIEAAKAELAAVKKEMEAAEAKAEALRAKIGKR
jgi:ubiquinone biosynthesis protein UbiJ